MPKKRNVFQIDEDSLDQECIDLPRLVRKYTKIQADAKKVHTDAEKSLALIEAKMKLNVRRNPGKFGLPDKPPVPLITAAVIASGRYQAALEVLNKAKYDLDIASSAVKALETKKRELSDLVVLHGQNYYTDPDRMRRGRDYGEASQRNARRGYERKKQ